MQKKRLDRCTLKPSLSHPSLLDLPPYRLTPTEAEKLAADLVKLGANLAIISIFECF
jgi:hypothetical protein